MSQNNGLPDEVLKTPEVQELVRIARLAAVFMSNCLDRQIRQAASDNLTTIELILCGKPFREAQA